MATRFRKMRTRKMRKTKALKTRKHRGGAFSNLFTKPKKPPKQIRRNVLKEVKVNNLKEGQPYQMETDQTKIIYQVIFKGISKEKNSVGKDIYQFTTKEANTERTYKIPQDLLESRYKIYEPTF